MFLKRKLKKKSQDSIRKFVDGPVSLIQYDFDRWDHPAALMDSDVWRKFKIIELQDGNFTLDYHRLYVMCLGNEYYFPQVV